MIRNFPFGCPSCTPGNSVLNIKTSAALLRSGPRRWAGGGGPGAPTWSWCSSGGALTRGSLFQGTFCPGGPPCMTVTSAKPARARFPSWGSGLRSWAVFLLGGHTRPALATCHPQRDLGQPTGGWFWVAGMRLLTAQLWLLGFSSSGSLCSNGITDVQKRVFISVKIATTALPP